MNEFDFDPDEFELDFCVSIFMLRLRGYSYEEVGKLLLKEIEEMKEDDIN